MEEVENLLLIYAADRTRASREKAAIALYNYCHSTGMGMEPERAIVHLIEAVSARLHIAATDLMSEVDDLYC